jgi:hypothetical protein
MAFEIQSVDVVADLEEIIKLLFVTSNVQEPMKTILGNASDEDKWALIFHTFRDRLIRPGAASFKMVETSTKYDPISVESNAYAYYTQQNSVLLHHPTPSFYDRQRESSRVRINRISPRYEQGTSWRVS